MKVNSFPTLEALKFLHEFHRTRLVNDLYRTELQTIQQAISSLRRYLSMMEKLIQEGEEVELGELVQQYPPEINEEYWAYVYPNQWQAVMFRHFRASFVISALSVFEHYLKQICRDSQFISQYERGYEAVKSGSTIANARQYLSAEIGFKQPNQLVWTRLQDMYEIRNVLVHAFDDIYFFRRQEKLIGLVEKYPGIEITVKDGQSRWLLNGQAQDVLDIKPEFCDLLTDTIAVCLDDLCGEMTRLCKEGKVLASYRQDN